MPDIDTGGGGSVGGDVGAGRDFVGRDETDHRNNLNVYFDHGAPMTDRERAEWRDRQIAELRYALLGDDRYGVDGMVDSVRRIWTWLYIIGGLLVLLLLMQLWQQIQIHQILQQLTALG